MTKCMSFYSRTFSCCLWILCNSFYFKSKIRFLLILREFHANYLDHAYFSFFLLNTSQNLFLFVSSFIVLICFLLCLEEALLWQPSWSSASYNISGPSSSVSPRPSVQEMCCNAWIGGGYSSLSTKELIQSLSIKRNTFFPPVHWVYYFMASQRKARLKKSHIFPKTLLCLFPWPYITGWLWSHGVA